ncbi:cell wall-active antibiotic response 4TMS protein YvqF [Saccharothrix australiensis]|uniref:Cell wall-active antibiotic response 4TMS protein YvqF n=2 Tax=Saccharothrix australiensis TaxID=2072 RepID=A0A495W7C7_9PSEU|nr:cell wall-active antibiotic response 4TMS protein YvqF [Saccharothrix australiensis]
MRASDADREKVARLLQQAHGEGRLDLHELDERLGAVYAAKTYGELAPLTADLGMPTATLPSPVAQHLPSNRIGGVAGPTTSIAFWSGVDRKGEWVVPATHSVVAIMGGVALDLSRARFVEAETTINVFALWGGVEIRVPEDVTVRVDGAGIMGAFEDNTHDTPTVPGGPVVRITGVALMAGVEVRRPKRKKLKGSKHGEIEG